MVKRGQYINLHAVTPKVDKEQRAKPLQARMRSGGVRFNKDMGFYAPLVDEMLVFPRGQHDDQVDALAYIGLALDKVVIASSPDELEEEEWQEEYDRDDEDDYVGSLKEKIEFFKGKGQFEEMENEMIVNRARQQAKLRRAAKQ